MRYYKNQFILFDFYNAQRVAYRTKQGQTQKGSLREFSKGSFLAQRFIIQIAFVLKTISLTASGTVLR